VGRVGTLYRLGAPLRVEEACGCWRGTAGATFSKVPKFSEKLQSFLSHG